MKAKQAIYLIEVEPNTLYERRFDDGITEMTMTLRREEGLSPNGNPLNNCWVLRVDGEFIDFDQYRFDLAARRNLILMENK
jgi:hypothetical protein